MSDITLAWKRRTLVCTGPATFYLAVPVVGSAPDARAAYELVSDLQGLCRGAAAADGTSVRAVRGNITATARGAHLSMYITVAHPSNDPHRDAAYVDAVIRTAARCLDRGLDGFESATFEGQRQLGDRHLAPTNGAGHFHRAHDPSGRRRPWATGS